MIGSQGRIRFWARRDCSPVEWRRVERREVASGARRGYSDCFPASSSSMVSIWMRGYNADNGLLYVNTTAELVDLFDATRYAAQEISRHAVKYGLQEALGEGS